MQLYLAFACSYLFYLAIYSGMRLFFWFWNLGQVSEPSFLKLIDVMWNGLRFDLSALSFIYFLPFLLTVLFVFVGRISMRIRSLILALVTILLGLPFIIINNTDIEYIHFAGRRFTWDTLYQFREVSGKTWQIITYAWPVSANGAFMMTTFVVGVVWIYLKWLPSQKFQSFLQKRFLRSKAILVATPVILFIALAIFSRGGLQTKPLNFAHAQIYNQPILNTMVMNSAFSVIKTMQKQGLVRDHYFDDQNLMLSFLNGSHDGTSFWTEHQRPEKPNMVLIILESFSLEYVGAANGGFGYTPFLDELAKKGILFTNAYATARRSIEGMGAILGGVPALMTEPFISSPFVNNQLLGIGSVLSEKGYHTSFFHGAKNGSMYFDQFASRAGIQNYFGLSEYPDKEDFDGTWGIWDEPFLNWMADQIETFPKPFFSTVFTLSSHQPFSVPSQYQGKFPKGNLDIHETIGYTDYALKEFFKKIEKQPWFENTLFVITADHTYKLESDKYNNEIGVYRIPIIFFHPKFDFSKVDRKQVISHLDIMPSIYDMLGIELKAKNYLAESVFENNSDRSVVVLNDQQYQIFTKDIWAKFTRSGQLKACSITDFKCERAIEDQDKIKEIENKLRATQQYFSEGLLDNKFYLPK